MKIRKSLVAMTCVAALFSISNQVKADTQNDGSTDNVLAASAVQKPTAEQAQNQEQAQYDRQKRELGYPDEVTNLPGGITYAVKGGYPTFTGPGPIGDQINQWDERETKNSYRRCTEINSKLAPASKTSPTTSVTSVPYRQTIHFSYEDGTPVGENIYNYYCHTIRDRKDPFMIGTPNAFQTGNAPTHKLFNGYMDGHMVKGLFVPTNAAEYRMLIFYIDPFDGKVIRQYEPNSTKASITETDNLSSDDYAFLKSLPAHKFKEYKIPQIDGYHTVYSTENKIDTAVPGTILPEQESYDQDVDYYVFYVKDQTPTVDPQPSTKDLSNYINYIDQDGKIVKIDHQSGQAGDTIVLYLPDGYHYKDNKVPYLTLDANKSVQKVYVVKDQSKTDDPEPSAKDLLNIINYVDQDGHIVKTDHQRGRAGDDIVLSLPDGYRYKDNKEPHLKLDSNKPLQIVYVVKDQSDQALEPTQPTSQVDSNVNQPTTESVKTANQTAVPAQKQPDKALPQTGASDQNTVSVLCLLAAGFGPLMILKRKKQN